MKVLCDEEVCSAADISAEVTGSEPDHVASFGEDCDCVSPRMPVCVEVTAACDVDSIDDDEPTVSSFDDAADDVTSTPAETDEVSVSSGPDHVASFDEDCDCVSPRMPVCVDTTISCDVDSMDSDDEPTVSSSDDAADDVTSKLAEIDEVSVSSGPDHVASFDEDCSCVSPRVCVDSEVTASCGSVSMGCDDELTVSSSDNAVLSINALMSSGDVVIHGVDDVIGKEVALSVSFSKFVLSCKEKVVSSDDEVAPKSDEKV